MPMARRSRSPHFKEPRAGINMFTAPKTARKQSHGYNSMGDLWGFVALPPIGSGNKNHSSLAASPAVKRQSSQSHTAMLKLAHAAYARFEAM